MGESVQPVSALHAVGGAGVIDLTWEHTPWDPLVDHYAVHGAEGVDDVAIGPDTLLATTVFSHFTHGSLGGGARSWVYRVVTVDAAGSRSAPTRAVPAVTSGA